MSHYSTSILEQWLMFRNRSTLTLHLPLNPNSNPNLPSPNPNPNPPPRQRKKAPHPRKLLHPPSAKLSKLSRIRIPRKMSNPQRRDSRSAVKPRNRSTSIARVRRMRNRSSRRPQLRKQRQRRSLRYVGMKNFWDVLTYLAYAN